MSAIRRLVPNWPIWVWIILGLAALVFLDILGATIFWALENYIFVTEKSEKRFHYWFQILTGNWSEQSGYQSSSYAFSLVASTAFLLNIATLLVIFAFLLRISRQLSSNGRVPSMILDQALRTKELVTRQNLIDLFSDDQDTIDKINTGFRQADEEWYDALAAALGRPTAEYVFDMLKREIPTPSQK